MNHRRNPRAAGARVRRPLLLLAVSLALAAGCGDEAASGSLCHEVKAGPGGEVTVTLTDAQNYTFVSDMTIASTRVKPRSDLLFDWAGLDQDLVGQPLDPRKDVDLLQVMVWRLPGSQLATKLNRDDWTISDLVAIAVTQPDNKTTSARYFDLLTAGASPVPRADLLDFADPEVYPPAQYSRSVMLSSGTILGMNPKVLALFEPAAGETNTTVRITAASTDLDFDADLRSLRRVPVPAGSARITVDWTAGVQRNALGKTFLPTYITEVLVAHYPDHTPAQLEEGFLNLELLARGLWRATVPSGTSVRLDRLRDDTGQAFAGVSRQGTWVLALICGLCSNPAPWFLTVFEAC